LSSLKWARFQDSAAVLLTYATEHADGSAHLKTTLYVDPF